MLRLAMLFWLCVGSLHMLHAQLRRFYELDEAESFDTVDFTLKATSGISFIRHVDGGNPLNIFGNPDLDRINPSFHSKIGNNTCKVKLTLDEYRKSMVGDGLVFAMMGSKEEEEDNYWKFLINDSKVYNLDLSYGIGSSDVDLSGTAINKLKITTGSADVVVDYSKEAANMIEMDTFMVKVDLGSIKANKISKARAKNLIAEIGFGQGLLDFEEKLQSKCDVHATIGAGRLNVILPNDEPVIIYMKDSPLCNISMPKSMEKVEKNVYVNMEYEAYADNLLTIYVEVAMGSVNFQLAKE
jgi:hypothetical protein